MAGPCSTRIRSGRLFHRRSIGRRGCFSRGFRDRKYFRRNRGLTANPPGSLAAYVADGRHHIEHTTLTLGEALPETGQFLFLALDFGTQRRHVRFDCDSAAAAAAVTMRPSMSANRSSAASTMRSCCWCRVCSSDRVAACADAVREHYVGELVQIQVQGGAEFRTFLLKLALDIGQTPFRGVAELALAMTDGVQVHQDARFQIGHTPLHLAGVLMNAGVYRGHHRFQDFLVDLGSDGRRRGRRGLLDSFQAAFHLRETVSQRIGNGIGVGVGVGFRPWSAALHGPERGLRKLHSYRAERQSVPKGDGQVPPDGRIAAILHIT